jgi:hypothetical protein
MQLEDIEKQLREKLATASKQKPLHWGDLVHEFVDTGQCTNATGEGDEFVPETGW